MLNPNRVWIAIVLFCALHFAGCGRGAYSTVSDLVDAIADKDVEAAMELVDMAPNRARHQFESLFSMMTRKDAKDIKNRFRCAKFDIVYDSLDSARFLVSYVVGTNTVADVIGLTKKNGVWLVLPSF